MASVFSKIISGEFPGRFVWADDVCVAFATIEPIAPGHVLVVPRVEVDQWSDLNPNIFAHVMLVAQTISKSQRTAFGVERTLVEIIGFDVPHMHVHVIPAADKSLAHVTTGTAASDAELDEAMDKLRTQLAADGYEAQVNATP